MGHRLEESSRIGGWLGLSEFPVDTQRRIDEDLYSEEAVKAKIGVPVDR